jgi:ParB family chromosome partitioning protein
MTHADLHAFQRAPRERREPSKREAQRIEKLQAKMQEVAEAIDAATDADDEEKADALQEEGETLGEQLQALEDGLQDYGANVKAAAGAIVTIDRNGEAVIHRGLMREAEAKALRTLERLRQGFSGEDAENDDEGEDGDDDRQPKTAAMSDRLAQRLSAHRTAALQIEVARHPQTALAAVVHGMVQTILQERHYGHDLPLGVSLKLQDRLAQRLSAHRTAALQIEVARHPQTALAAVVHGMVQTILQERHYGHDLPLGVSLKLQDRLEGMAPDWPESPAAVALRELQQVAGEGLPEDSAELFAVLLAKPQDELVKLLAVCVASTVDVVTPRATPHRPGEELAQAVGLDMAAWWQPTAEGYFKHVPKAAVLQAVSEYAPDQVSRLAKLKKTDIASEAERLADGTGWMPAIFKAQGPQDAAQDASPEQDAPDDAEAMADEPAEALAA